MQPIFVDSVSLTTNALMLEVGDPELESSEFPVLVNAVCSSVGFSVSQDQVQKRVIYLFIYAIVSFFLERGFTFHLCKFHNTSYFKVLYIFFLHLDKLNLRFSTN